MPFLATCPFCPAKFQLSRKVLGGSVRCPECGNYFTAVPPEEDAPVVGAPALRALAGKKRVSAPAPPVAEVASSAVSEDQLSQGPAPPEPRSAGAAMPRSLPAPGTPIPGWINVWGLAALLLGGVAFFLAGASFWIVPLRYLTVPFSGLGLAACLIGFLASLDDRKIKDVVWLALGGMVSLAVLVVAMVWPRLLNINWGSDFAVPDALPNKTFLVSPNNQIVARELTEADWVDAGKAAYRHGDVFVRVVEVKIDEAPVQPPLKDKAAMRSLLISLKIANVGQLRMIPYAGQGSGKHPAVLKDSKGQSLAARHFGAGAKMTGQTGQVVLRASKQVEDLLVFASPPRQVEHLDLELNAAAWGGKGTCKLRIPARMISWPDPIKGGPP